MSLALFEIGNCQFQLLDEMVEFLRGATEAGALQARELRLQLLDIEVLGIKLRLQLRGQRTQFLQFGKRVGSSKRHAPL